VSLRGRDAVRGRTLTFALVQGNKEVAALGSITTGAAGDEWTHTVVVTVPLPGRAALVGEQQVRITATGGASPLLTGRRSRSATWNDVHVGRDCAAVHGFVQCPGDTNGDAVIDAIDPAHPRAVCKHSGRRRLHPPRRR